MDCEQMVFMKRVERLKMIILKVSVPSTPPLSCTYPCLVHMQVGKGGSTVYLSTYLHVPM